MAAARVASKADEKAETMAGELVASKVVMWVASMEVSMGEMRAAEMVGKMVE